MTFAREIAAKDAEATSKASKAATWDPLAAYVREAASVRADAAATGDDDNDADDKTGHV